MPIRKNHLSSLCLASILACALPALAQSVQLDAIPRALADARAGVVAAETALPDRLDNRFRIGIDCAPAPEALRVHLRLHEDAGLLVNGVLDNSPSGRAGIKRYDVIIEADGHPVSSVRDLIVAVNEAKDSEMTLTVIQEGTEKLLKLTPEERDEDEIARLRNGIANQLQFRRGAFPQLNGLNGNIEEELQQAIEQMQEQLGPLNGAFRRVNPGIMLDQDNFGQGFSKSSTTQMMTMENGEELSISVEREQGKPAQITVKRGSDSWELSESDLDELPEDVRPLVESQLNGRSGIRGLIAPGLGQLRNRAQRAPKTNAKRVQERFDGLELKMQELQDAIRSIQGNK